MQLPFPLLMVRRRSDYLISAVLLPRIGIAAAKLSATLKNLMTLPLISFE